MRVSNSNNTNKEADVSSISRSRKNERASKAEAKAAGADGGAADAASVSLSGDAKALSKANKLARSEDSDQAKINKIKALINEGNYKPDYGKVADKMVNEQLMQDLS